MNNKLIIFAKNPELGKVKSRLARTVGEVEALRVYNLLLDKCKNECNKLDAEKYLYYTSFIDLNDNWDNEIYTKKLQSEGNLGSRMSNAFSEINENNSPTIIIGSDCYDLNSKILNIAFDNLQTNDMVIGPANDGGYYLLGLKKYDASFFNDIEWSTETVFSATLKKAEAKNLKVSILQELIDIDTFEDLKKSSLEYNKK